MTTPAKVIAVAKSFVDKAYVESKADDTIFGKWYGMNHAAWCAMFVSYCFGHADASKLVAASTAKGFASCTAGANWFRKHKAFFHGREAKPGDVVFMAFDGDLSDPDHVGICYKVDHKKGIVYTYEGNTSKPGGSQNLGEGCYKKERPYKYIVGVGRPAWSSTPPPTPPAAPKTPSQVKTQPKPATPPKAAEAPLKTYLVKAGDSYWAIAEKHPVKGLSTNELTHALQKLNGNKPLHPGDKIKIK